MTEKEKQWSGLFAAIKVLCCVAFAATCVWFILCNLPIRVGTIIIIVISFVAWVVLQTLED